METKELKAALIAGTQAALDVVNNWESGNLAGAVSVLDDWKQETEKALQREQARRMDDTARKLVNSDVLGNVSHFVYKLSHAFDAMREHEILDWEELEGLARRPADADDYEEAHDSDLGAVRQATEDDWEAVTADELEENESGVVFDTALEAWAHLFEETGQDAPEGCEALEHWLVTDWLARRLREQGESLLRWGVSIHRSRHERGGELMATYTRYVVRPDMASRYRLPLVHRLEFSRSAQFGDWIADTGECATDISAAPYHLTSKAAHSERLDILTEAMKASGEAVQ